MSFSIFATIASLLGGIIYFFPGELLYRSLRGTLPGPALIAIYFLGLALCVFLVIFALSKLLGNYNHLHYTFGKTILMVLLMTCIGVPAVSAGTEFLYELGIQGVSKPKNYVFLIDNSGSMSVNDPGNTRRGIVEEVANSLPEDSRVGVYVFSNGTNEVIPVGGVAPGSVSIPEYAITANGGTELYGCITDVAEHMPDEMTKDRSKFIILTDGNPTDNGYNRAVDICNEKNIAVSCVGFGRYSQATFIDLANRTGGNFMSASDVSQLKDTMSEVVNQNPVNRDLVSSRNDSTSSSALYAFLRVLFIILIGLVFAYLKYLNAALPKFSMPFLIACLISALLGGIFIEAIYQLYWIEAIGRFVLCLAFAFTPLLSNNYYTSNGSNSLKNSYGTSSYGTSPYGTYNGHTNNKFPY